MNQRPEVKPTSQLILELNELLGELDNLGKDAIISIEIRDRISELKSDLEYEILSDMMVYGPAMKEVGHLRRMQ
jgi:hypothetical protein